jgi:hypothetical protein
MERGGGARVPASRSNRGRVRSRERGKVRREGRRSWGTPLSMRGRSRGERVELKRGGELGVVRTVATGAR